METHAWNQSRDFTKGRRWLDDIVVLLDLVGKTYTKIKIVKGMFRKPLTRLPFLDSTCPTWFGASRFAVDAFPIRAPRLRADLWPLRQYLRRTCFHACPFPAAPKTKRCSPTSACTLLCRWLCSACCTPHRRFFFSRHLEICAPVTRCLGGSESAFPSQLVSCHCSILRLLKRNRVRNMAW